MEKNFVILAAVVAVIIAAIAVAITLLPKDLGEDDLRLFRGIPTAEIPQECRGYREDVCALFDCMVDRCWCDDAAFPSPILLEGSSSVINEQEAIAVVEQYVQSSGSEYSDVRRAVNLGDEWHKVFFNVFAYNAENDEKVFTVAADGTIIKTICGV